MDVDLRGEWLFSEAARGHEYGSWSRSWNWFECEKMGAYMVIGAWENIIISCYGILRYVCMYVDIYIYACMYACDTYKNNTYRYRHILHLFYSQVDLVMGTRTKWWSSYNCL